MSILFVCFTTPVGVAFSTTPLGNKIIKENLGKSEGADSACSLFGLWMLSAPDIDVAINNTIRKKKGGALINVRWYETTKYFILFSIISVNVIGDVVKFEESK